MFYYEEHKHGYLRPDSLSLLSKDSISLLLTTLASSTLRTFFCVHSALVNPLLALKNLSNNHKWTHHRPQQRRKSVPLPHQCAGPMPKALQQLIRQQTHAIVHIHSRIYGSLYVFLSSLSHLVASKGWFEALRTPFFFFFGDSTSVSYCISSSFGESKNSSSRVCMCSVGVSISGSVPALSRWKAA